MIAGISHLPIENMRLVFHGNILHDSTNGDDMSVQLNDGGLIQLLVLIVRIIASLYSGHNSYARS